MVALSVVFALAIVVPSGCGWRKGLQNAVNADTITCLRKPTLFNLITRQMERCPYTTLYRDTEKRYMILSKMQFNILEACRELQSLNNILIFSIYI